MARLFQIFLASLMCIVVMGCGQNYAFNPVNKNNNNSVEPTPTDPSVISGSAVFNLQYSQTQFNQDVLPINQMAVQFQITDDLGFTINDLRKDQIAIKENGVLVSNFNLDLQNNNGNKTADIVVVLDVTTSMDPYISELKKKISRFVDALSQSNVKARLCLVTFGESTEDKCTKFVENNPATPQNENLDDFIKKVSAINTHGGGTEPDENQLPAIEDAAQITPWGTQAQRVAILITDAGFHYAPDNIGEGVNVVPTYDHTLNIIQQMKMQTFVISFPKTGYDRPLKNQLDMPRATSGEFYNLGDIVSGLTNMEEIFKSIAARIAQQYVVNYVVDQNPNLNPELTLGQRLITLEITDPKLKGTTKILNITSSLPQGRSKYKNKFKFSDKKVDQNSVKVWINNQPSTLNAAVTDTDIEFDKAPDAGSLIQIQFLKEDLKENLNYSPTHIKVSTIPKSIEIVANGVKLSANDFKISVTGQGVITLTLADQLLTASQDILGIRNAGSLTINYKLK